MSEAIFALWRLRALLAHPRLHAVMPAADAPAAGCGAAAQVLRRMLWRKLFDRNPLLPLLADKLAAEGGSPPAALAYPSPPRCGRARSTLPSRAICCARG